MATRSEKRISVADYERMFSEGLLTEDDHVELLEGVVRPMEPIGAAHIGCVIALTRLFAHRVPVELKLLIQSPVELSPDEMPEPDFALLRPDPHDYRKHRPTPADVQFLIEVCDTSLERDLMEKLPRYAAAGIAEVWLVDLPGQRLLRFREPAGAVYRRADVFARGDALAPEACPDARLTLDEILGPPLADSESAGA